MQPQKTHLKSLALSSISNTFSVTSNIFTFSKITFSFMYFNTYRTQVQIRPQNMSEQAHTKTNKDLPFIFVFMITFFAEVCVFMITFFAEVCVFMYCGCEVG